MVEMEAAPGVRSMLMQAWQYREAGNFAAALSLYREAAALVAPDSGLGVEIGMLMQDVEAVAPPLALPGARHTPTKPGAHPLPDDQLPPGSHPPLTQISGARPAHPHAAPPAQRRTPPPFTAELDLGTASRLVQVGILKGRSSGISIIACSPDGETIGVCGSHRSGLWNLSDGTEKLLLDGAARCLAFSPDGFLLAVGIGETVRLLRTDGTDVLVLQAPGVSRLAFSPDGALLAGATPDGVQLWQLPGGALLRTLEGSSCLAMSGELLATGAGDGINLWRLPGGKLLRKLKGHSGVVRSVAFSPSGSLLASASADCTVRLWQARDGKPLRTLNRHTAQVTGVAFHAGGELLASGSGDKTVRIWAVEDGALLATLKGHLNVVECVAFAGARLASGSYEGIRLWACRGS